MKNYLKASIHQGRQLSFMELVNPWALGYGLNVLSARLRFHGKSTGFKTRANFPAKRCYKVLSCCAQVSQLSKNLLDKYPSNRKRKHIYNLDS
ncbi:MAG: hypothetical protein ITG01_14680 [Comamonas sp.]|nr:hypothetical protein [Comamonas sp.]